jgi:hypothetical protein
MKLDHTKPELYRHRDGRKVVAITELKRPLLVGTHIIHFEDNNDSFWAESDTFLIEVKPERWQGLEIDEEEGVLNCSGVQDEIGNIKRLGYAHALNLDTLEVIKL